MALKRHTFNLTESTLRQIEYVLPKLKYSSYIREITNWLENFEESEAVDALDFLFYLEYITSSELQLRIEEQLGAIEKKFGDSAKYIFCSYAMYPKSNDVVLYLLSKCPTYIRLKKDSRAIITKDLNDQRLHAYDTVIFVDDIVGSGGSFDKWYREKGNRDLLQNIKATSDHHAILAAIIMESGKEYLLSRYPDISIFAEVRSKVFSQKHSPFNLSGNRTYLNELALKYGKLISNPTPMGFSNSESLVSFEYGTPNNSLPIIWSENNNWHPIFPRFADGQINKAAAVKSEAAFYIGLINRLNIHLEDHNEIKLEDSPIKFNKRDDHSILVYLILKDKIYSSLTICQVIGITLIELSKIILKAQLLNLVDDKGEMTKRGHEFLKFLKTKKNRFQFRDKIDPPFDETKIFIPKSFGKAT